MKKLILLIVLVLGISLFSVTAFAQDGGSEIITGATDKIETAKDNALDNATDAATEAAEKEANQTATDKMNETDARIDTPSLKEYTFDVSQLSTDSQKQGYFSTQNGESRPIVNLISSLINFAIGIIGSLAVILLIVAGFMFMAAQGNQQQIDNAKEVVKYAVIGLAAAFLSYTIIVFVQSVFTAGI